MTMPRVLLPFLALACRQEPPGGGDTTPSPTTCARAADAVRAAGDANGDGVVDLADPVLVLRHLADGGVAPACAEAVDLVGDGRVQLDDAFGLLVALGEGLFTLDDALALGCADAEPLPAPEACASLAAAIDAPASVETGTFSATVTLASPDLAVEAWSLPVTATGCTVTGASTDGTAAAPITAAPAGLRDQGYDATVVADGAATSVVVLAFMQRLALPADGTASPVLALQVQADTCGTCTLTLGEPATGHGPEIPLVIVAQDAAWPLDPVSARVTVCP